MVLLLFFNSEVVKEKMERIKSEASFWGPSPDRRCHAWSVHCYIPAAGNTTAPREKAGQTNEQASPQIDENYELPIQASLPPQDCSSLHSQGSAVTLDLGTQVPRLACLHPGSMPGQGHLGSVSVGGRPLHFHGLGLQAHLCSLGFLALNIWG